MRRTLGALLFPALLFLAALRLLEGGGGRGLGALHAQLAHLLVLLADARDVSRQVVVERLEALPPDARLLVGVLRGVFPG